MQLHNKRCVRRVVGLQLINEIASICGRGMLSPLVQGGLVSTSDILTQKVELSSCGVKQLLLNEVCKRITFLMNAFNDMTQQARNLNLVLLQSNQCTEQEASLLEEMKLLFLNVSEINQLLSVNDKRLWSHPSFCDQILNTGIFEAFIENVLQTLLLNSIFSNLGPQYQPFLLMAHYIVMVMRTSLYLVVDFGLPRQVQLVNNKLLRVLCNEIGLNGEQVNSRQLVKVNDLVGINRINLLLSHIHDSVLVHKTIYESGEWKGHAYAEVLLFLLYHSNVPSSVRLISKSLRLLFTY